MSSDLKLLVLILAGCSSSSALDGGFDGGFGGVFDGSTVGGTVGALVGAFVGRVQQLADERVEVHDFAPAVNM